MHNGERVFNRFAGPSPWSENEAVLAVGPLVKCPGTSYCCRFLPWENGANLSPCFPVFPFFPTRQRIRALTRLVRFRFAKATATACADNDNSIGLKRLFPMIFQLKDTR